MKHAELRLNYPFLPVVVSTLALLVLVDTTQVWKVLLFSLGSAWLIAYLWARSLLQGLSLRREVRYGWAQVGDHLENRFTVQNSGWATATWLEVIDHSDIATYQNNRVTGIEGRTSRSWRTEGICTQRGVFNLGPTSLRTGDPLSIYTVLIHDPTSVSLMVAPPIVPLPYIDIAPGGRSGAGRPRPNAPERSVSASHVRPYVPGDDMRLLHWRTTARHATPYLRVLDGTPSGDWWIILDLDRQVQVGQGWDSTLERGILLAASLADRGLRQGSAIGLAASGEQLIWLSPQAGENHRWEILRALALANPGNTPLDDLLASNPQSFGRWASLVLITPNRSQGWVEALLPLLWRGATPTVLLLEARGQPDIHSAANYQAFLHKAGIHSELIAPDLFDRPEVHPGTQGQWGWRIGATGRAIPTRKPADMSWRTLS
jgi:uncharacterized protein (DUF58 family)